MPTPTCAPSLFRLFARSPALFTTRRPAAPAGKVAQRRRAEAILADELDLIAPLARPALERAVEAMRIAAERQPGHGAVGRGDQHLGPLERRVQFSAQRHWSAVGERA